MRRLIALWCVEKDAPDSRTTWCCAVDPADEDAAYDEMLAERRTLLAKLEGGEADDDDDDLEGFLNGDWTDDEEIETALNNVDVFNMLVAAMNSMKSNEPERFQVCPPRCQYRLLHRTVMHVIATA